MRIEEEGSRWWEVAVQEKRTNFKGPCRGGRMTSADGFHLPHSPNLLHPEPAIYSSRHVLQWNPSRATCPPVLPNADGTLLPSSTGSHLLYPPLFVDVSVISAPRGKPEAGAVVSGGPTPPPLCEHTRLLWPVITKGGRGVMPTNDRPAVLYFEWLFYNAFSWRVRTL